jgi:hypothetical protein
MLAAARTAWLAALVGLGSSAQPTAAIRDQTFDDPLFRRCITWMLEGYRGALLQNVCMDEFDLPQPSIFLCARKIRTGFSSETDREGCAIVFEEEAKKVRAGYIR